jgi:DNA-binding response OmpR family regulator
MKRILVVDDNHDILEVINIILEMEGYQVKLCDDGEKVQQLIFEFDPDLILLDIMLGAFDGREICKVLKDSKETRHIPVIMISASHTLIGASETGCGASDFIAKPFEITDLVSKVQRHVA